MIDPIQDRRPPLSPQLAVRVAVLGVVAFALFAIIFFRLWYLQVLSGDQYRRDANQNKARTVRIPAPRGEIVDRSGTVLVENRPATVLTLKPNSLPDAERTAAARYGQLAGERERRPKGHKGDPVPIPSIPFDPTLPEEDQLKARFARLGRVVGMSATQIQRKVVESLVQLPYAAPVIKTDVPSYIRDYLLERSDKFPGVQVERTYLRKYPQGNLAAQIFGTVNEISERQLRQKRFRGVLQGTKVGQDGLEYTYDRFLRGRDGITRYSVDANGQYKGSRVARQPQPGRTLKLSLDLGLQRTAQKAFLGVGGGRPGAFVAMDPTNGQVLAMGSYPTFDPNVLARSFSQATYDRLTSDANNAPLLNRAIDATYPTGSTFKPITALASLQAGIIAPGTTISDSGCTTVGIGPGSQRCNAGHESLGSVNMVTALQKSSDVYFYQLGGAAYNKGGLIIQREARRLGLGRRTGIDLPGEFKGNIPDPEWRARLNRAEERCRKKEGHPCGIADGTNRPYSIGDNVSLAIGQGDVLATPLQMAVVYSAIVTDGRVPRPHLGLQVEDEQGRLVQKIAQPAARRVRIDPGFRDVVMQGLHLAASAAGGTSADVFSGWDQGRFPIFGKTGTAQTTSGFDQSWYVAYAYDRSTGGKPIVIATTIEKGGFGAETAAPATCLMLSRWFGVKGKCAAGKSITH